MAYATRTDIETIYGADALYFADRDGDGTVDVPAIERALASASAEIDGHLAVRYSLPLEITHEVLVQVCVDIALYRLAGSSDVMTDELRQRYEDAMATLKKLAEGKMLLVEPLPDGADDPEISGPQPIVQEGPERLFSRDRMRDF